MANQNAKFIDVTKTFVPLDPKSFPISMHGTSTEDAPEQKIPVMAYEGKNIIPTAHGYSSYFGLNRVLDINALPARCDKIFIVQNEYYRNILVALTEAGIYIKQGNATGAWVQATVMVPPTDDSVHYEWTTTVINQKLYAYRQGQPSYQLIQGDLAAGVIISSVVPSFLNMVGQVGIFRAGGRLGFWDADSSVAWSNLDDFADFTPSILTLANAVKFSDVNGRIVTIVPHGAGFIIYCTKSIVYVRPNIEATFQWDPTVVFSTNGIAYPRQIDIGTPDTIHFAATTIGLYKIENGQPTNIVPEVTDVLEKLQTPLYLRVMEGRYLFLEIIDPDFLDSLVQFSRGTINDVIFQFPGSYGTLAEAVDDELLQGTNMCSTLNGVDDGVFDTPPADPVDKKPGTEWRPKWTAYLSKKGQWGPVTDWTNVPVATLDPNSIEKNQCPVQGAGNLLSANNTTSTGKTVVTGDQMYIDGIWTMERFVAVQQAIWDLEEASIDEFINSVIARSSFGEKISHSPTPYTAVAEVIDKQLIGDYARRYTQGYFGFSKCEFWLTRYCYQASKIYRIKRNITITTDERIGATFIGYCDSYSAQVDVKSLFATEAALATAIGYAPGYSTHDWSTPGDAGPSVYVTNGGRTIAVAWSVYTAVPFASPFVQYGYGVYECSVGSVLVTDSYAIPNKNTLVYEEPAAGRYRKTEQMYANNREETYDVNPFVPDTGYCTRTGWNYTTTADNITTIASAPCDGPSEFPKGSDVRLATASVGATIGSDGSFCSIPFESVTVPGTPPVVLNWPDQSVALPGGTFLLQDGSIAPVYPTMYGALVYDLFLKKWGKMNQNYRLLLDYSPVNNADTGGVPYSNFGILGGVLSGDYLVKLFDNVPIESYITYGKIGYYRMGYTAGQEVHVQFATNSTGYIKVDTSYDGKQTESSLTKTAAFSNSLVGALTGINPGRWHNITISGQFDINYLEYRGFQQGRR